MKWMGLHVCLAVLLSMTGCEVDFEPGTRSASDTVQALIADPVPGTISGLQGICETWQGYAAYLRFKTSEEFIDELVSKGYRPVDWSKIAFQFKLPGDFAPMFTPPWNPSGIATKECYEADAITNKWTHSGANYLVIDRKEGVVYFYSIGA